MSSCICTIIKNEHQYLDEWIQYHLSLGINHIFLFEDIDSESHSSIANNYRAVSLFSLSTFLSTDQYNEAAKMKQEKHMVQSWYLPILLSYISTQYKSQYDWCFVIDDDEFITLTSHEPLSLVLNKYNDYDAIILQWEVYGANGRIARSDLPIFEAYTKLMQGPVPRLADTGLTKTCYNLHTYQNDFIWYIHQPSDKCNFCRTNFSHSRTEPTYEVMYLRHYMTRSFEEYVWKRLVRGYCWGHNRLLWTFFSMNPELKFLQDDLLFATRHDLLVVLPYNQKKSQGKELQLALTGWRKNCQFNYHFVIIGEFDSILVDEYKWVEFIPLPNLPSQPDQYNPHLNMLHAYEEVAKRFRSTYPGFITMADDFYAIRPFSYFELFQTHCVHHSFNGVERLPTSYWKHDKWKTRQLLDREELPHINYTTHFPCYYNFNRLYEIWDKFNMRSESYVLEDVYFNYFKHETPFSVQSIRYGVWEQQQADELLDQALTDPHIKFLFNSVEGWSPKLEQRLSDLILNNS